jgi:glycosyltransferase involved in cell wall biosynthesis
MAHTTKLNQQLNLCVVTYPSEDASGGYHTIIMNLLRVVSPLVNNLFLITGAYPAQGDAPRVHISRVNCRRRGPWLGRIVPNLLLQLAISRELIRLRRKIQRVFIMSGTLLLPTLTARILGKSPVLIGVASESRNVKLRSTFQYCVIKVLESVTHRLATRIVVESPNVASFMKLDKCKSKVIPEGALFFCNGMTRQTGLQAKTSDSVGYIGRFSEEKGILNLLQAFPMVLTVKTDASFVLGGDGPLRSQVEEYAAEPVNRVKFVDWIPHDRLPRFLNELMLLVMPSYTEGLPNIMLEAMFYGTPVLATPVGGIPDIIRDGETGFVMENNSPDCIAANIIRALNHPSLEQIARNARTMVEQEFTYEKAVERYRSILESTLGKHSPQQRELDT